MKVEFEAANYDRLVQALSERIGAHAEEVEAFIRKSAMNPTLYPDGWASYLNMDFHFFQSDEDDSFEVIGGSMNLVASQGFAQRGHAHKGVWAVAAVRETRP